MLGSPFSDIPDICFFMSGIKKQIEAIRPDKACSPDLIPAQILHEAATELAPVFAFLFQSYNSSEGCKLVCNFQKGTWSDPANYRPVLLTSLISKVTEHVVCCQMALASLPTLFKASLNLTPTWALLWDSADICCTWVGENTERSWPSRHHLFRLHQGVWLSAPWAPIVESSPLQVSQIWRVDDVKISTTKLNGILPNWMVYRKLNGIVCEMFTCSSEILICLTCLSSNKADSMTKTPHAFLQ